MAVEDQFHANEFTQIHSGHPTPQDIDQRGGDAEAEASNHIRTDSDVAHLRLHHLDMLRGAASLAVLLGHLRAFLFVSLSSTHNPTFLDKCFYAITSLGHQAVIVFFALSGYLVGGKALADMFGGVWQWDRYLLRRLTRLWIVLIPALLLTAVLDHVGMSIGAQGYSGLYYGIYASGPHPGSYDWHALIGNLLFLQTIEVPVFGTDGPLWSLSNEFWYYILFPVAFRLVGPTAVPKSKLVLSIVFLALVLWLPRWMVISGLVWVAGAASARLVQLPSWQGLFKKPAYQLSALLACILAGTYAKSGGGNSDVLFGLAVASALRAAALFAPMRRSKVYVSVAKRLAEISYTVYPTHFPFLAFLFFVFFAPHRMALTAATFIVFMAVALLTLAWSSVIWWCFERHTDTLYRLLSSHIRRPVFERLRFRRG